MNGTDTVGRSVGRSVDRSVGRSVDARGPVDHDSVGLAQARPNKSYGKMTWACPSLALTENWDIFACVLLAYWCVAANL